MRTASLTISPYFFSAMHHKVQFEMLKSDILSALSDFVTAMVFMALCVVLRAAWLSS